MHTLLDERQDTILMVARRVGGASDVRTFPGERCMDRCTGE
jgi:hypothetical protein